MARHLRKHNRQFYTFGATKVPSVTQDRYYSADWVRDMRYNEQLAARAMLDLLGVSSVLVSGGLVTQGSSVTKANITAAVGFCDFDVEVPSDDTAWSVPVAFETRQIAVTARSPALTDFDLSATSMVFDGSTPNYLKLKYLENNVKSRTRKYGATSYSYSVEDSYAIVCDTSAVTAKDVLLATLVGNGTSVLTITQNVNTAKVLKATNADSATTSTTSASCSGNAATATKISGINTMMVSGTTGTHEGDATTTGTGFLGVSKILSCSVFVERDVSSIYPPEHKGVAGCEYSARVTDTLVIIALSSTNSENILSKPFRAWITYTD